MSFPETVLLSAFAGLTIFLGLPVGRLRNLSARSQVMLTAAAAGIVLFLLWDILSQAIEPVETSLKALRAGDGHAATFAIDAGALLASVSLGLLSIVWVTRRMRSMAASALDPRQIALGTAVGLGLHNLSEGLAIGQSAATGATSLAVMLVVGFAAHNATEGFGIAAPLTSGERPSWGFLALTGLVGGGPTFLGGVMGYTMVSDVISIVFLGLAAGALIFVFNEMVAVSRRLSAPGWANIALLFGLIAAFGTDFVLILAGA